MLRRKKIILFSSIVMIIVTLCYCFVVNVEKRKEMNNSYIMKITPGKMKNISDKDLKIMKNIKGSIPQATAHTVLINKGDDVKKILREKSLKKMN